MKLTGGAWSANAVGGMTFQLFFEFGCCNGTKMWLLVCGNFEEHCFEHLEVNKVIRHAFLGVFIILMPPFFAFCLAGQAPAMPGRQVMFFQSTAAGSCFVF